MRLATFKSGQGLPDVLLSAFPGDTGGLLANINRWRGQLGLDPIDDAQLAQATETATFEGVIVTTVDLTGSGGQEMLGAVVVPGDGQTWFVKATGEPAAIAQLKPTFGAFARSFRLHREAAGKDGGAPGANATQSAAKGDGGVQARLSAWKPPSNWVINPSPPQFVTAAFDATNADGGAKITATMLVNDGGGVMSNINRWRDQMGLPPVERLDQQSTIDVGAGSIVVDLSAADNTRRMLAAIVSGQNQTWFFKVTGTPKGVESEMANYKLLVRGVGLGAGTP
jgi:hypothetical protein